MKFRIVLALLPLCGCVSLGHHQRKLAEVRQQVVDAQQQKEEERKSCEGLRHELAVKDARLRSFNQLNDNGTLRGQE